MIKIGKYQYKLKYSSRTDRIKYISHDISIGKFTTKLFGVDSFLMIR